MSGEGKYEPHHETKPAEVTSYGVVAPKEEVKAPVESTDRGLFGFGGKKEEEKCEDAPIAAPVESTDRGLFGFGKKKEEKCEDATIAAEFEEKVQVSGEVEKKEDYYKAPEEEKKHESLGEKLHRSNSSSSSSSDEEEVGEDGLKKKKKKGLKEKIAEKIKADEKTEAKCEDTSVPVEKHDAVHVPVEAEEKKGFLEKIKEKLPGGKKDEVAAPTHAAEYSTAPPSYSAPPPSYSATTPEAEGKEKKGFMDKIKEKLPGYHPKTEEEKEKEKEKDAAC